MPSYDLIRHINRDNIDPTILEQEQEIAQKAYEESSVDPDVQDNIEIENRYRTTQESWASDIAIRSEELVDNIHFTEEQADELAARGQAALPLNYIAPAVKQSVAMMTTNKPIFQVTAREDSDRRGAAARSDLLRWIWDHSDGNPRLKQFVWDYQVKSRGVFQVYVDPDKDSGKGEICFIDLDPLEVFPDPNCRDPLWRDASHIIVSKLMTREQIESLWPDLAPKMGAATTDVEHGFATDMVALDGQTARGDIDDGYHDKFRVIERYTKVKVPYANVVENFSDEEFIFLEEGLMEYLKEEAAIVVQDGRQTLVNGPEAEPYLQLWEQGDETADPRIRIVTIPEQMGPNGETIPPRMLEISRVNNEILVQLGMIEITNYLEDRIKYVITVGNVLYSKGYLPTDQYTIIPCMANHNRTPYTTSNVIGVAPMQMAINKLQALMIANLATSTNVKAFVPRGSIDKEQVEADFAKAGASIIEYDPEYGSPVIAQPVPMSGATFQQIELLIQSLNHNFGIHPLSYGDASQAPSTAVGTIEIEEFGQRRIKSMLDDIETSLNQVARVILQLIPYVYNERKVIRIIEPNNQETETVLNQPLYDSIGREIGKILDMSHGKYDSVFVSGSSLPSNRWARLRTYIELYQAGIIDQVEVLKKTDVVDAEGVINRASQMSQLQQQNAGLDQENKELKGDIQTRERELYHTKMQLEVEKGRKGIQVQAAKTENRLDLAGMLHEKTLNLERREAAIKEDKSNTSTVKR